MSPLCPYKLKEEKGGSPTIYPDRMQRNVMYSFVLFCIVMYCFCAVSYRFVRQIYVV